MRPVHRPGGYHVLNGLALLAAAGVIVYFVTMTWRWFREDSIHAWRDFAHEWRDYLQGHAALFLVGLFGVIVVGLLTQWARVTWSSQGRLVFSAISTWSIYFVLGLATIATARFAKAFIAAVGVFMFVVSTLAPFTTIAPVYTQPAPSPAPRPQTPLEVTFGDQLKLIGADIASSSAQPGGRSEITLYWQALKPIEQDFSTFVHLLDANDIGMAQRVVSMEINDDGRGFDMESMNANIGHGLANMRTRARSIGGDVDISSAPNEGTTVLAWVPRDARQ